MNTPAPADLAAAVKAAEAECAAASERLNAASAAYAAAIDDQCRAQDKLMDARIAADSILPKAKIFNRLHGFVDVVIARRTPSTIYTRHPGEPGEQAWRKRGLRKDWRPHPKPSIYDARYLVIDEEHAA